MRKKYLSALLFGALLLASAGTFTSCKDYDDDIKNLQEQINTVKTSLDELTTKVNNLGAGIKDFKYENGQLVIVTDKDTNFTVDLPACEGITNLEIKDGVLYADGVAVGNVTGDGGSVVEVKDGVLYIDGKAQELTVGDKVVVVDNGNGTYTLTVGENSYVLPKASAAIYEIKMAGNDYKYGDYYYFTEDYLLAVNPAFAGVNWGVAAEDLADWTGPKGAIKKGQLLVGAINTLDVVVTPKNADLTQAKLTLVDTKGAEAPVKVTPKRVEDSDMLNPGSRAVSADGTWTLSVETTATAEDMATAYAGTDENGDAKNLKYALAVDGVVMTDYEFSVDTWTAEEVSKNTAKPVFAASKFVIGTAEQIGMGNDFYNVPVGSTKLVYKDASIYDVQIDIAEESKEDAELLDITVDKTTNTLVVGDKAAGVTPEPNKEIKLDIILLGVNGKQSTKATVTLSKFATTEVSDKQTLATTEYTLTPSNKANAKNIIINMEDVFTGLSAEESTDLQTVTWTCTSLMPSTTVKYYASLEDAQANDDAKAIDIKDNYSGSRVRSIKYAVIQLDDYSRLAADAEAGKYEYDVVLVSTSGNKIKKAVAPINISLPKFEDLYELPASVWNESVVTLNLNNDGEANFLTAVKAKEGVDNNKLNVITAEDKDGNAYGTYSVGSGTLKITSAAVNDESKLIKFTANATYSFTNAMVVKSSDFTVNPVSVLNGATIDNLNEKAASVGFEVTGSSKEFAAATDGKSGVVIKVKSDVVDLKAGAVIGGVTLADGVNVKFSFDNQGDKAKASLTANGLKVEGLGAGNYTTVLTVSITDGINVITEVPVSISVKN